MKIVNIPLNDRSYTVTIGAKLHELNPRQWGDFGSKAMIITDRHVAKLYAGACQTALKKCGFKSYLAVIAVGEKQKNLSTVSRLYHAGFRCGLDRKSLIIALGGGVVGDLAGFVAATFLRGLAFIQIPTTLLAQVDAAIGGKTGVDTQEGKNLIGAFYQPKAVWIDPEVLRTLPSAHFVNGMAEVIKYGMIADAGLFELLEKNSLRPEHWNVSLLEQVISRCVRIKSRVVSSDEREEKGKREILNFGHTIGHALEAATHYQKFLHGEAVSLGMIGAAHLAERMLGFKHGQRLERLCAWYRLPTRFTASVRVDEMMRCMQRDKKNRDAKIRFVLPQAIGRLRMGIPVNSSLILQAVRYLYRKR